MKYSDLYRQFYNEAATRLGLNKTAADAPTLPDHPWIKPHPQAPSVIDFDKINITPWDKTDGTETTSQTLNFLKNQKEKNPSIPYGKASYRDIMQPSLQHIDGGYDNFEKDLAANQEKLDINRDLSKNIPFSGKALEEARKVKNPLFYSDDKRRVNYNSEYGRIHFSPPMEETKDVFDKRVNSGPGILREMNDYNGVSNDYSLNKRFETAGNQLMHEGGHGALMGNGNDLTHIFQNMYSSDERKNYESKRLGDSHPSSTYIDSDWDEATQGILSGLQGARMFTGKKILDSDSAKEFMDYSIKNPSMLDHPQFNQESARLFRQLKIMRESNDPDAIRRAKQIEQRFIDYAPYLGQNQNKQPRIFKTASEVPTLPDHSWIKPHPQAPSGIDSNKIIKEPFDIDAPTLQAKAIKGIIDVSKDTAYPAHGGMQISYDDIIRPHMQHVEGGYDNFVKELTDNQKKLDSNSDIQQKVPFGGEGLIAGRNVKHPVISTVDNEEGSSYHFNHGIITASYPRSLSKSEFEENMKDPMYRREMNQINGFSTNYENFNRTNNIGNALMHEGGHGYLIGSAFQDYDAYKRQYSRTQDLEEDFFPRHGISHKRVTTYQGDNVQEVTQGILSGLQGARMFTGKKILDPDSAREFVDYAQQNPSIVEHPQFNQESSRIFRTIQTKRNSSDPQDQQRAEQLKQMFIDYAPYLGQNQNKQPRIFT